MRTTQDLRQEFDWVDATPVDTHDLHSRIHAGIGSRRIAQRRRVAVLSVAAAAVVVAIGAIVVPSLGDDRSDQGQVATTPTPGQPSPADRTDQATTAPDQPPPSVPDWSPTALYFTVGEIPQGYGRDGTPAELVAERADVTAGNQARSYEFDSQTPDGMETLSVRLYSPELAGLPSPDLTGESIEITSASGGPMTLNMFDVEGFFIAVGVDGSLDEAALLNIAESIVVILGAATDRSVWTEQPVA